MLNPSKAFSSFSVNDIQKAPARHFHRSEFSRGQRREDGVRTQPTWRAI
jgi:hypothetical protein